jgi:hypothetical protein
MAIGLNLGNIKIVERIVANQINYFNHVAEIGVDFNHGFTQYLNGLIILFLA